MTFTETTAGANPKFSVTLTVTQGPAIPDGPIPITHLEQLNAIRYDLNGDGVVDHAGDLANTTLAGEAYAAAFPGVVSANSYTGYELANDLDFSNINHYNATTAATNQTKWTSGAGWVPIGLNHTAPFTGMFDGGGHTISNLYINGWLNASLFGRVTDGATTMQIQNVGLVNPSVTGGTSVNAGGLVGQQVSGTISNCYVSGGSSTTGLGTVGSGGLVGYQSGGTISNCYVSGGSSTSGDFATAGGLVGRQENGTISTCYVKGGSSTAGNSSGAGGLVGVQDAGTIRACYVSTITATVGSGGAGSLVGYQNGGELIASYAGGTGKNYTNLKGGGSGGMLTNSYYQAETTQDGNDETNDVGARTETELKAKTNANAYNSGSIYEDWDLNLDSNDATQDPWDFGDTAGGAYPKLKVDFDNNGTPTVSEFGSQ